MAKSSSGALDTNTLLRLTLGDVPAQTACVENLLEHGGTFDIADIVLVEVAFVLEKVYEMPRNLVTENLLGIIRNMKFRCNRKVFELALPTYEQNQKVSIVDCLLVAYAELNKTLPLHTFDKKLAEVYPDQTNLLK